MCADYDPSYVGVIACEASRAVHRHFHDFRTVEVLPELTDCVWRVVPGLFHLDQAQAWLCGSGRVRRCVSPRLCCLNHQQLPLGPCKKPLIVLPPFLLAENRGQEGMLGEHYRASKP